MLNSKSIERIYLSALILSGIFYVLIHYLLAFSHSNNVNMGVSTTTADLFRAVFTGFSLLYFKLRTSRIEELNFVSILWKLFVFSSLLIAIHSAFNFLFSGFSGSLLGDSPSIINGAYALISCLVIFFFSRLYFTWKRFIMFMRTKRLVQFWLVFETFTFIIAACGWLLNLSYLTIGILVIYMLLSLYFSGNLKWVAYLTYKQKIQSIAVLGLIFLIALVFISYFFNHSGNPVIEKDLFFDLFFWSIISFGLIYLLGSLLVLFFNLPTSSVFEQKVGEVLNFQQLSESLQMGEDESHIYNTLLTTCVNSSGADSAWVTFSTNGSTRHEQINASQELIQSSAHLLTDKKVNNNLKEDSTELKRFGSMFHLPILVKGDKKGSLVLFKEVKDGFNKELTNLLTSFVNQAAVSIDNLQLIEKVVDSERYKEELKLAQTMQSDLLPSNMPSNEKFEISALSEPATEVGGDFYDFDVSESGTNIIIGDVSGKGISAAFNMAQMKGIFHSIAQLGLNPEKFMIEANLSLSKCLDKKSFITATLVQIEEGKGEFKLARAGHCPALYFSAKEGRANYLKDDGMGLGILRNKEYKEHISETSYTYNTGDLLMLYTDGVFEAQNANGEIYGYDRLLEMFESIADRDVDEIQLRLIADLNKFRDKAMVNDDFTIVLIKFL